MFLWPEGNMKATFVIAFNVEYLNSSEWNIANNFLYGKMMCIWQKAVVKKWIASSEFDWNGPYSHNLLSKILGLFWIFLLIWQKIRNIYFIRRNFFSFEGNK